MPATIANLVRQNPGEAFDIFRSSGHGGVVDFWSMLRWVAAATDEDLLALEDDIVTARNFLPYVASWRSPHMTSFFFMCGGGLQTGRPEDPRSFGFSQALWFPRDLLQRLAATVPPAARGQDDALGIVLAALGEKVIYHRSLVQHVGVSSLCQPGQSLEGRQAPDFVGESFDCLTLLSG